MVGLDRMIKNVRQDKSIAKTRKEIIIRNLEKIQEAKRSVR